MSTTVPEMQVVTMEVKSHDSPPSRKQCVCFMSRRFQEGVKEPTPNKISTTCTHSVPKLESQTMKVNGHNSQLAHLPVLWFCVSSIKHINHFREFHWTRISELAICLAYIIGWKIGQRGHLSRFLYINNSSGYRLLLCPFRPQIPS